MMLRLRPHGSWSGWLSYTLVARARITSMAGRARSWDQRHAVNLGIVWSKGPWTRR